MSLYTWYHVVYVVNADYTTELFVNGVSADTDGNTTIATDNTSGIHIGSSSGPSQYWDGNIDNVRFYDHSLIQDEIDNLYSKFENVHPNESQAVGGDLIHEYNMDSVSGSALIDTAGSINLNNSNVTYLKGKVGNSGFYNRSASIASVELLGTTFSADLWINASSITFTDNQGDAIFSQGANKGDGKQDGWGVWLVSDKIQVYRADGGYSPWDYITFSHTFTTYEDYHIHIQRNSNTWRIWVNNKLVPSSGAIATPTSGYNFRLGLAPTSAYGFHGSFDQVRFYSRLLTEKEISNLYNKGRGC